MFIHLFLSIYATNFWTCNPYRKKIEKEDEPLEVVKDVPSPKKEYSKKEMKETVKKAFGPVENKISRSLLLPPRPLRPIASFKRKYQLKKELSKLLDPLIVLEH